MASAHPPEIRNAPRRTAGRLLASGVVIAVLALGLPMFACNALTGAGELSESNGDADAFASQKEGATTTSSSSSSSGNDAPNGSSNDAPFDPFDGYGFDTGLPSFDSGPPPKDAAAVCDACDSGTCQAAGGFCDSNGDCCSGLKCSSQGKCVQNCALGNDFCFGSACCLGFKCSFTLSCNACAVGGNDCTENADCCSSSCVGTKCVGTIPAQKNDGGGPGGG